MSVKRRTDMSETKALTHITDLRTVGVPVAAQDEALEFYVGKLGFETRLDLAYGEGERWIEVAPPGAATTIALVRRSEGEPIGVDTGDHAQLRALGVDVDADVMPYPIPMFSFRDADGNRLVIVGRGG
jgi:catechol 2,3-dioxygenase-like lactoylglutathione lyase family enzyme